MTCRVTRHDGFRWIDLIEPTPAEVDEVRRTLGIEEFSVAPPERPELIDSFDCTTAHIVGGDRFPWMTLHIERQGRWLVTVHGGSTFANDSGVDAGIAVERMAQVHVTDFIARTNSLGESLDDEVEAGADLAPIRRAINSQRRASLSQRDVLERLAEMEFVPNWPTRAFQSVIQRMSQAAGELEALREAVHDSASDRQNSAVYRLTIVAAVILPLTFWAGFWGQNFGWLTDHIESPWAFWLLGVALPLVSVGGLLGVLRWRRWL